MIKFFLCLAIAISAGFCANACHLLLPFHSGTQDAAPDNSTDSFTLRPDGRLADIVRRTDYYRTHDSRAHDNRPDANLTGTLGQPCYNLDKVSAKFCDWGLTCVGTVCVQVKCIDTTNKECADASGCTFDSCDPKTGICVHTLEDLCVGCVKPPPKTVDGGPAPKDPCADLDPCQKGACGGYPPQPNVCKLTPISGCKLTQP